MPPIIPLILAGAGLYAGAKWLAKALVRKAEEARVAADVARKRTSGAPRDLGTLEFDSVAKVYRPTLRRSD